MQPDPSGADRPDSRAGAPDRRPDRPGDGSPDERADRLKERVYVTFAALAVVLTLRSHVEETTGRAALATLLITVGGTLLAVLLADLVSHMAVHATWPTTAQLRHMLRVSLGSVAAVATPLVLLALAVGGVLRVDAALRAATITLLVALGAVGWLAVRRVPMTVWQRVVALTGELVPGSAVVALELAAHH
ncbi:MAG TPA: hypothetical protein VGC67_18430 [Cellulomonas sp.]